MMSDPAQTIGKLIDKQKVAFIASVDTDGFPIYPDGTEFAGGI